jgi:hypothetical protein
MGVDMYYCEKCQECLHSDCFKQCNLCYGKLDDCDECYNIDIHERVLSDVKEKINDD